MPTNLKRFALCASLTVACTDEAGAGGSGATSNQSATTGAAGHTGDVGGHQNVGAGGTASMTNGGGGTGGAAGGWPASCVLPAEPLPPGSTSCSGLAATEGSYAILHLPAGSAEITDVTVETGTVDGLAWVPIPLLRDPASQAAFVGEVNAEVFSPGNVPLGTITIQA